MTTLTPTNAPERTSTLTIIPSAKLPPSRLARTYTVLTRVLLLAVGAQVFFAGLAIFGVMDFGLHALWGMVVILGSLSLPIVAAIGRLGRAVIWQSTLLTGLMFLQGILIDLAHVASPIIGALHPVNAVSIVLVLSYLGRYRA